MPIEKVILVEDEEFLRQFLVEYLRGQHIDVTAVPSIEEAEGYLARDKFEVMFLDLRLPDGDGAAFLEELHNRPSKPLIIVMTGHGSVESGFECIKNGAFDYLIKPFSIGQIDLALKKAENFVQFLRANNLLGKKSSLGDVELTPDEMAESEEINFDLSGEAKMRVLRKHRDKVTEFQRKHRIGLMTLLFTDMVDSTRLKQELGDREAVELIQRHHTLVRRVLRRFPDGEEISTAGDSFFMVFCKPSEAVKFALFMQAEMRQFSARYARPIFDRIGIHVGEVFIEENAGASKPKDLYGIQVDICARVMSLGCGNQILLTRFAYESAKQVLRRQEVEGLGNLTWESHGAFVLKGVEEPLEICEVGEEGAAPLRPPAGKARRTSQGTLDRHLTVYEGGEDPVESLGGSLSLEHLRRLVGQIA